MGYDGDVRTGSEPTGAQDPQSAAEPAHALDAGRLRSLFLDLLGRTPFEDERARWLGRGTHALLDEVLGSAPFWRHWLDEQLYYFMLIDNFTPRGEGVDALVEGLVGGRLSVRDALHRIALLPSFDLRNPGADTFVTVVMEQFLGITVQLATRELEIGKAAYDGRQGLFLGAQAKSQSDVVRIAAEHKDAARHFIAREHLRIVGAPLERRALAAVAREQAKDPRTYLASLRSWLTSEAYTARLAAGRELPNRLFVRALFVDLLQREPSAEEAETLRSALDGLGDPRPLRAVFVRMLLDSGQAPVPDKAALEDPTAWVRDQFRRLLGRDPSDEELREFCAVLREPACSPGTILQVLLSDPAYHRY